MVYSLEEPKVGKGKYQSSLGRNKHGKIKGQGDKKCWWHANRLLVSRIVWPCPVPDQHRLSCLLIKLHF